MSRVAIVTAGGQGIGAACARRLAADGFHVVLMSRSEQSVELAAELGGTGIRGSVSEPDDLRRLVETAGGLGGPIEAVVNNTGHAGKGELLEIPDEAWHEGLDLLLLNVVRMARLVTPIMREQGGGTIVNISTFGAVEPSAQFPISSAIRAGLSAFTRMYADQEASHGIRMNNVLPGFVDSYPVDEAARQRIPAGRYASVDEVAATVAFLASGDAAYITGQNVTVDGGLVRRT